MKCKAGVTAERLAELKWDARPPMAEIAALVGVCCSVEDVLASLPVDRFLNARAVSGQADWRVIGSPGR